MCYQDNIKMQTGKELQVLMAELRAKNMMLGLRAWKLEMQNRDLRESFKSFRTDDLEQINMLEEMLIDLCEDIMEGVSIVKLQETANIILSNVVEDSKLGGADFGMEVDE
jgi:hypothetical protein